MVDIINWENASTTAADNLAVAGISDAEGWLPSTVNNFTRASWAVLAKFWDEYGGGVTVAGTADAITITTTGTHTALSTGLRFVFKAGADNTTAVTLNLDAIGAKAIRKISGGSDVALVAGDLKSGRRYDVVYDSAANSAAGAWILVGTPGNTEFTTIELGHASDTTLSRVSAGVAAIEGATIATLSAANVFTGVLSVTTTSFAPTNPQIEIISTSDASNSGPWLSLYRNSATPAANDLIGGITWQGLDSGATKTQFGNYYGQILDPTDGSEDFVWLWDNVIAGTSTNRMKLGAGLYMAGATDPGAGMIAATHVLHGDGLVGTPSVAFASDPVNGFYLPAADNIGVAVNGVENSRFTSTILGVGATSAFSLSSGSTDGAYIEKAGRFVASIASDSSLGLRRRTDDGTIATFHRDTTNVGTISVTTTNTAYNTSSDERLKENFNDFDAGAIIDQMALYEYQWKADGSTGYGPKAQELYEVFPLAVKPGNDLEPGEEGFEPWQWDGNPLVALCLKEIQSLRKRVAELEAA